MTASGLVFRRWTPRDVGELLRIVNGAYRGGPRGAGWTHEHELIAGPRITEEALRALDRPGSVVLVAERGGAVVGCVHLEQERAECHLGMLSVDVEAQAAGIGRALVAEAERFARQEMGARSMVMEVVSARAELLAWYERRGYRRTGRLEPFSPPPMQRFLQGPLHLERLEKPLGGSAPTGSG